MSAPRFRSPMLHPRPQEHGTDPVEVGPPADLDRVDHPDECGSWLVAFIGAVVGLTVLCLGIHVLLAMGRFG